MSVGGKGFLTLVHREGDNPPIRMAYLLTLKHVPPRPEGPDLRHDFDLEFYEFWSPQVWEPIVRDAENQLLALAEAGQRDEVYMRQIMRRPSGPIVARDFSLINATWAADMSQRKDGKEPWATAGGFISMPLRISITNTRVESPVYTPNPVVEFKDHDKPIDNA